MLEYIVDCELRPLWLDGRQIVTPYTTAHHVHERIIRCRDCNYGSTGGYCKLWHKYGLGNSHFCSYGTPKVGSAS